MIRRFAWILIVTALLVPFQNCTGGWSSRYGSGDKAEKSWNNLSGGQPYDGKPYVEPAQCPDGTLVGTRVVMRGGSATVYREGCQTVAPRRIDASAISQVDGERIRYGTRTLEVERPAIPLPGVVSWFLQLTGILQPRPASIYIVDMFGKSASEISDLKRAGHTVICNISAGTVENWNPDADQFLREEVGRSVPGGPGERYLDIRSSNVRQIMLSRLNLARDKGCHGIDFDSTDGFVNNTGFPLTRENQLEYNTYLAFAAHDRGLILTLNAVPELASELAEFFDIAVAEQCFTYNECGAYEAFTSRAKPVLVVEYGAVSARECAQAKQSLLSLAYLNPELDGSRYETCPQ
ncbi:MAG: endo alpha-1,4 polygalactosaminidase [Calothrix sp. SM1_5_4]|nr:endo alpha-1,4 polygalactosaminidase [Calothrix sp. SM1_5_4]